MVIQTTNEYSLLKSWLPRCPLDVKVSRVAERMDATVCPAGDVELDGNNRFLGSVLPSAIEHETEQETQSSPGNNVLLPAKYIMPPYCSHRSNREFYCELQRWMEVGLLTSASTTWFLTLCPRIILKRTYNMPRQLPYT